MARNDRNGEGNQSEDPKYSAFLSGRSVEFMQQMLYTIVESACQNHTDYYVQKGFDKTYTVAYRLGWLKNGLADFAAFLPESKEVLACYQYIIPELDMQGNIRYIIARKNTETVQKQLPFDIPSSYYIGYNSEKSIWNAKALYAEDVVFITETWTDAFSIIQNGSSAIALNRIGNIITLWSILQKFPKASANRYYIACDADEYGRRITSDLHSMLNSLGLSHYDIPPYPDEIKDCNEWLIADPKGFHAMISYIISQA